MVYNTNMKQTRNITISEYELPIIITKEESGYSALCKKWSDCFAQADTLDEVIAEISQVAASLIELYKEENMHVPLRLIKTRKNLNGSFSITHSLLISA